MLIDMTIVYRDFKGEPLKQDGNIWTMGEVIKHVLMQPPANPAVPYDATEHRLRYELAKRVNNALVASQDGNESDASVDFPPERVAQIRSDVCRLFGPILAGQVVVDLDG